MPSRLLIVTNVIFRMAGRSDVPAVAALLIDDKLGRGREGTDVQDYLDAFDEMQREAGNSLIVGESGARVIACYQLTLISGLSLKGSRRAQIEGVRVAAEFRGQGIGTKLLADAEKRARDGSARLLQFTSNASRPEAHRLYLRCGYAPSHIGFKKAL